jgi:glutathione S-transferase
MKAAGRERQGEDAPSIQGLSIYGYPQCPYCRRVLDAVSSLELEIPLRNTLQDSEHRRALVAALGRATVPVLLIEDQAGDPKWLPESADILRYLADRFGGEG